MTSAVCYIATDGYVFQTVVSALQARANVGVPVHVVHLGDAGSSEAVLFGAICRENDVVFQSTPIDLLSGLHPVFSRFFLDHFLPSDTDDVLYVDGDTQVIGSLDPLMEHAPGTILAARDPMVFIEKVNPRLRGKITGWWDSAGISPSARVDYVNAGVLRLPMARVAEIRRRVLELVHSGPELPFKDQDAINLLLSDEIGVVSSEWNFPGFLLGTPLQQSTRPRVVHFMSSPRPWNAALAPWGPEFFSPYSSFVEEHPQVRGYWEKFSFRSSLRYRAQYAYKYVTERRSFVSEASVREFEALEETVGLRTPHLS